jgi:indole-3-acetate monooxygenase
MSASLADATARIVGGVRERAEEHERARQLSNDTVADLKSTDILRAYVPAVCGGPEYDPFETMAAIESLSAADGSTGWCATIASLTSHIAGSLSADAARTVFSPRDAVACGVYAPSGRAIRQSDDSFAVTGAWAWGSGSSFATWMTGGAIDDAGVAQQVFFRADQINVHDTWHSNGLRATASHDFGVDSVRVPAERVVALGSRPVADSAISRMPLFVLFSGGVASVMLGIATRAIEELTTLAAKKKPVQSSKTLAVSPMTQVDLARAEVAVRSARAFLHENVQLAWETILRGDRVDLETRLRARLAASNAGEQACAAVNLCYRAGGGSAVYETSPLQRCFRDVHTASAHVMVSARTYETVGRHRLGLDIDASSL